MRKSLIALFIAPFFLQGCAIGMIAYGVGNAKKGNAQKIEARAKQQEAYGNYKIQMEKLNTEREQAKLAVRPIMSFDEWANGINNPNGEESKVIQSTSTEKMK
jgi:hypothetical protein